MTHQNQPNRVSAFEAGLSRLSPAAAPNAAEVMFQAGRQAEFRSRRRWQCATAGAVCLCAVLAAQWLAWPRIQTVERVVVVEVGRPVKSTVPVAAADDDGPRVIHEQTRPLTERSYLNVRRAVMEQGLSALPEPHGSKAATVTPGQLREQLLREEAGGNG